MSEEVNQLCWLLTTNQIEPNRDQLFQRLSQLLTTPPEIDLVKLQEDRRLGRQNLVKPHQVMLEYWLDCALIKGDHQLVKLLCQAYPQHNTVLDSVITEAVGYGIVKAGQYPYKRLWSHLLTGYCLATMSPNTELLQLLDPGYPLDPKIYTPEWIESIKWQIPAETSRIKIQIANDTLSPTLPPDTTTSH